MNTTLLFYKKPVALARDVHRHVRFKPLAEGFAYAAQTNAVPLALIEFPNASVEYPIVFITNDTGDGTPMAITGLRDKENLFIDAKNNWDGDYIPAFVRRYPFALFEEPGSKDMYVLIDEEAPGYNAPDGQPLFNEDGKEGELLSQALQFVEHFKHEGPRAQAFIKMLRDLDLLVPQSINVESPAGGKISMEGFMVVDEERLMKLDDAKLLELTKSGDLARIHAHLMSLNNLPKLLRRIGPRLAQQAAK